MALILLLICIGLQRYLKLGSYAHRINWIAPYYHWMVAKITQITKGHGLLGVSLLIVPVVIIVALIFALVMHLLGWVGYYALALAFLWYCMDSRHLRKESHGNINARTLFMLTYQRIFGVTFWFFVFGPVGLALYVSVVELNAFFASEKNDEIESLVHYAAKTEGVLDWVPVRILGLSFALVGHFGSVFKLWFKELLTGIQNAPEQAARWGIAAIDKVEPGEDEKAKQLDEAINVVDRSLLVWLVMIALFIIGYWVG